jgi:hypothetical protein
MPPRSPHRPPGRPVLPPERRRRRSLAFRANDDEIRLIRRRAGLARLPTAAYARACALRPAAPPQPVAAVNPRAYGQLGRLANNLNQLTKLAHQGRILPALLPCLAGLLAEVRRLRRQLVGLDPAAAPDPSTPADREADPAPPPK